jgi:hypothetical protein
MVSEVPEMLRRTMLTLLALVALGGCGGERQPADDAPPAAQPAVPKAKTGGCHNEHLSGECRYLGKHALEPTAADPPKMVVYQIEHEIDVRGEDRKIPLTSMHLRIPADRADELEEFFQHGHPVDCTAYIVHPPCNPQATSLTLSLDPPPFAEPVRR